MKCKCGEELTMMVNVTIQMPSELESRLSKKALRRKDVILMGANWDKASYYCKKCGRVI